MSENFVGEIRVVSFNFAPKGWALCNGQLLSIQQNQALFALLGTTYGGNGQTNFALPDLRGKIPLHFGNGYTQGQVGGSAAVTLLQNQIDHVHLMTGSNTGNQYTPQGNLPGTSSFQVYGAANTSLDPQTLGPIGGNQAHDNMSPYLTLNFIIALVGIFPSRS